MKNFALVMVFLVAGLLGNYARAQTVPATEALEDTVGKVNSHEVRIKNTENELSEHQKKLQQLDTKAAAIHKEIAAKAVGTNPQAAKELEEQKKRLDEQQANQEALGGIVNNLADSIKETDKIVDSNAGVTKQHLEDKSAHVGQKLVGDEVKPTLVANKCGEKQEKETYDPVTKKKIKVTEQDCSQEVIFIPASEEDVKEAGKWYKSLGFWIPTALVIAGGATVGIVCGTGHCSNGDKHKTEVVLHTAPAAK